MFENQSYETILSRMLATVPNDIDKREGSIIYTALAPAAAELTQAYRILEGVLRLSFAGTSSGEWLEKRTAELGVNREKATNALRAGVFMNAQNQPIDIPLNSRFSLDTLNYTAFERMEKGRYKMRCETPGSAGNRQFGLMLPIDYVEGLAKAELAEVLIPGEDTETDASLLNRYQLRVRQPATSGNTYQYRQWAMEVPGVGDAKIFPLWNGPGTVKVLIIDTEKQPASTTLVSATAQYIESVRPIGAEVTVAAGVEKSIEVTVTVVLASGFTLSEVQNAFAEAVREYLKETAFKVSYVSGAKIGTLLLSTPGVIDYTDLKLNGSTANVALSEEEVPVFGAVNLGV